MRPEHAIARAGGRQVVGRLDQLILALVAGLLLIVVGIGSLILIRRRRTL
jgi:hypothetical protein